MEQIKLWEVQGNTVKQVNKQPLDFENRLEKWLIQDISILSPNLAVIGSQVITPFGKKIDILAINSLGEIVIVELKRDKTYREVVAQALDYATWIKDLVYDDLNTILNKYGKTDIKDIGDFFSETFNKDAEEVEFNSDHKMLIVGSEIDDSTIRIINYLSNEPYSVNINAVNFNYFKDANGREFLAQAFIMSEHNITEESKSKKRKRAKSIIKELFEQKKLKVGDIMFFKPALDKNVSKNDPRVFAQIVNTDNNCLKRTTDSETHSFSSLRKIISQELALNVNFNWGYGIRSDWVNDNGKTLSDLLD
ncbi:MAG: hypothetical protein V5804_03620 [Mucilaginibacter sp.]|uniref:hypothetical protein n=1 Tax=Mucilaginibacter sp. TaxID=1882438 RepID=UPI0034E3CCDF